MRLHLDSPAIPLADEQLPIVDSLYEQELAAESSRHMQAVEHRQWQVASELEREFGIPSSATRASPMNRQRSTPNGSWFESGLPYSPSPLRIVNSPRQLLAPNSPYASAERVPSATRLRTGIDPEQVRKKELELVKSADYLRSIALASRTEKQSEYEKVLELDLTADAETNCIVIRNNSEMKVPIGNWRVEGPDDVSYKFGCFRALEPSASTEIHCVDERPDGVAAEDWWMEGAALFGADPQQLRLVSALGNVKADCEAVGLAPAVPDGPTICLDELSAEDEDFVHNKLSAAGYNDQLVHFKKKRTDVAMTRQELECLEPCQWLDDKAIEIYLHLVTQMRDEVSELPDVVLIKNSFFYTKLIQEGYVYGNVKTWTRRMGDLLARDKILVPINKDGNHWVMAVINMRDHRFEFYDALPSGSRDFEQNVFRNLRKWLCDESLDKRKETLDLDGWTNHAPMDIPHQENGYDCGMFALKYAQCVSLDLELEAHPFGQQHINAFRRRAIMELMRVPMKLTV